MTEKIVVLGGGPSGLGVAWELANAGYANVVVIEKKRVLGGLSGSFTLGGNTIDYGPHRFSPEFPDLIEDLRQLMGEDLMRAQNQQAVYFDERLFLYPPRLSNMLQPRILSFALKCGGSFLLKHLPGRKKQSDASFEGRVRHSFGDKFADDVIFPMCEKIWGNIDELDPGFADVRFSTPSLVPWKKQATWDGLKNPRRDSTFYYPRRGFQQIWDTLGEHLRQRGVRIILNAEATAIHRERNRVTQVTISDTEELPCEWLVSTIPASRLASLLELEADPLPPRCPTEKGLLLSVFVIDRKKTLPARVVIFPETRFLFNRLSEQNQFSDFMGPPEKSIIIADTLFEQGDIACPDKDLRHLSQVKAQILSLGWFREEEILQAHVHRVPTAYPIPTKHREAQQQRLNGELQRFSNVLSTGRFASSDYNNCHTALKKGRFAGKVIADRLPLTHWYDHAERLRRLPIRD